MLRSLVVALAALLLVGHGRDRADVSSDPTSERDRQNALDSSFDGTRWALSRESRPNKHGPVSEL